MRHLAVDIMALVVSIGLVSEAGAVSKAAQHTMVRTFHFPYGQYLIAEVLWVAACVVLTLPILWAARGNCRNHGRFHWGIFLLYALTGVVTLNALPLYMSGIGQPFAWVLERLAISGGQMLGGAMIASGIARGCLWKH
ncbi:MAG TPA: hypothetical protein VD902_01190 [Symbiobacteriaceae bacterium]|nr:hypothetical protein [Symbiobacteriaceae bacterium]